MSRSDSEMIETEATISKRFLDIMKSIKEIQNYNKKKEYTNIY
jgi:hypothetical protein